MWFFEFYSKCTKMLVNPGFMLDYSRRLWAILSMCLCLLGYGIYVSVWRYVSYHFHHCNCAGALIIEKYMFHRGLSISARARAGVLLPCRQKTSINLHVVIGETTAWSLL